MNRLGIIAASVSATIAVGGAGAGIALAASGQHQGTKPAYQVAAAGGVGGGDSGGPWPGNDYPASLQSAPQDSNVDPFGEDSRECVSYVAETLAIAFGYQLPFYGGNAVDWLGKATAAGVPSGTTPTLYSVAYSASHDHVALVVGVTGSGPGTLVTIEQYNADYTGHYSWDIEPASDFDHYIYFVAQSRPTPPTTTTTTSTTPTTLSVSSGTSGSPAAGSSMTIQGGSSTNIQGTDGSSLQGGGSPQTGGGGIQGSGGNGAGTAATTQTTTPKPAPTTTPTTSPPAPPTTTSDEGFTIEDDVYGGTWARTDPNDGTWYSHSQPPPNAAYWYPNGLGVAVSCAEPAATYTADVNGQQQTWNWWAHVTDGKWVPTVVFSSVWTNGDPAGLTTC